MLFDFAMNRDGRGWEQAVPGRTSNQSQQTWTLVFTTLSSSTISIADLLRRKSILPFIRKSLEERAMGGKTRKD